MAAVAIVQRKIAIRKEMSHVLSCLSANDMARQSKIVIRKVLEHPKYMSAESVSIYLSYEQEINTDDLVKNIMQTNKTCFIPRFQKERPDMEMVKLKSIEDFTTMPRNSWNIRQPLEGECRESVFDTGRLDLVIAPGLAFTASGLRLGRGKGFYDRFLARCHRDLAAPPFVMALAFNEQLLPELPSADTDMPVDCVVFAQA